MTGRRRLAVPPGVRGAVWEEDEQGRHEVAVDFASDGSKRIDWSKTVFRRLTLAYP